MTTAQSSPRAAETQPLIEIHGPWVLNKGDELMLRSILARLKGRAVPAASDAFGLDDLRDYPEVRRLRWGEDFRRQALRAARKGRIGAGLRATRNLVGDGLLPDAALERLGVARGRDLAGLLDCSGFAYGDQWSIPRMERRRAYYDRLRRRGVPMILLPQALGPFERPDMREAAAAVFKDFVRLYPRDARSHEHLLSLGVDPERVRRVPDLTHLLPGRPPEDAEAWADRACIVPNARMMDKSDPETGARYLDFLAACIRRVREHELEPWLVLHELNDRPLVAEIEARAGGPLPVFEEDAQLTKGVLGACRVLISSRFHAIVGGLSQGAPVIGTSWTHKYEALFAEYECPERLVSPLDDEQEVMARIDELAAPGGREAAARALAPIASRKKAEVEAMWEEVEHLLGIPPLQDALATASTVR